MGKGTRGKAPCKVKGGEREASEGHCSGEGGYRQVLRGAEGAVRGQAPPERGGGGGPQRGAQEGPRGGRPLGPVR